MPYQMGLKNVLEFLLSLPRQIGHIPRWMVATKERVSMGMAVVAVFGAASAYCAARAEQKSAQLEAKLNQGKIVELALRHDILDKSVQYAHFRDIQKQHENQAMNLLREAATHPENAASLELRAEEESAVARTLYPFVRFTWVELTRDLPETEKERRTDKIVSEQLSDLGFETTWMEKPNADGSRTSIWVVLTDQIAHAQRLVLRLASSIVVFVLALVFFTFAHLSSKSPKKRSWWTSLGVVTAIAGLIYAGWDDLGSWWTFAKFGAGIFLLIRLGRSISASSEQWEHYKQSRRTGRFILRLEARGGLSSWVLKKFREFAEWIQERVKLEEEKIAEEHLEELERPMSPGLRIPIVPVDEPFGRVIVRLIAGTALVSALMGLFFSLCTVRSNQAASNALDFLSERVKTDSMTRAQAYDRLLRLAAAREYQTRYWAAQQRLELSRDDPSQINPNDALRRMRQLQAGGATVDEQSLRDLDGDYGPDRDTTFPDQLLLPTLWRVPEMEFAKGVGQNEISLAWRRRATGFLRSLTLFAIALYLYGQSLGMGSTRSAFILAFYASALVIGGIFSPLAGMVRNLPPNEQTVLESAWHYGNGKALYEAGNLQAAVEELLQAAKDRPTFALASYYLAVAKVKLLSPQKQGDVSNISKDALAEIVDLREQGNMRLVEQEYSPPVRFLGNRGFDEMLLGYVQADVTRTQLVQNPRLERVLEMMNSRVLQSVTGIVCRYRAHKHIRSGIEKTWEALDRLKRDSQHAGTVMEEDGNYPWLQFNLGLAYLADEKMKKGDEAYQKGILGLGNLRRSKDNDDSIANLAAAAITDLNTLQKYCNLFNPQTYCDDLDKHITTTKKELIKAAWGSADASPAEISALKVRIAPNAMAWDVTLTHHDPKDVLTVLWFACDADYQGERDGDAGACDKKLVPTSSRDDHWKVWYVLPKFSGPSEIDNKGESWGFDQPQNSISQPDCLRKGEYQVEFYVNGALADKFTRDASLGNFEPGNSRDLNLTVCHPSAWRSWSPSSHSEPGWVRAYVSPDRTPYRGVFLFTYYYPKQETDITSLAVKRAQRFLESQGIVSPQHPEPKINRCGFPNGSQFIERRSELGRETLLSRAWVREDGLVHVGVVFRSDMSNMALPTLPNELERENREDCEILTSIRNIY